MSVDWLNAKMQGAEGFEPTTTVEGNPTAGSSVTGFASTAELSRAQRDPLYKSGDKAYHELINARLAKTTAF